MIYRSIKNLMKEKLNLPDMIIALIIGFLFMSISTFVHEIVGHTATAGILGCKASSKYNVFVGMTGYECPEGQEWKGIIIALAGPIAAFIFGLWAWFYGEDDVIRMLGLLSFYYSVIPNLVPWIPYTDMSKAIQLGLDPLLGWLIYLTIQSLVFYWTFEEILEKKGDIFTNLNFG